MKSIALIATVLFSSTFMLKEEITKLYHTHFESYPVAEIVTNLRNFEKLPAFSITGLTLEGESFYDFKGFPLKDLESNQKVYIIPKGNVLPNANEIQTFKVKVKRQFKSSFLGVNVIVLEEV